MIALQLNVTKWNTVCQLWGCRIRLSDGDDIVMYWHNSIFHTSKSYSRCHEMLIHGIWVGQEWIFMGNMHVVTLLLIRLLSLVWLEWGGAFASCLLGRTYIIPSSWGTARCWFGGKNSIFTVQVLQEMINLCCRRTNPPNKNHISPILVIHGILIRTVLLQWSSALSRVSVPRSFKSQVQAFKPPLLCF